MQPTSKLFDSPEEKRDDGVGKTRNFVRIMWTFESFPDNLSTPSTSKTNSAPAFLFPVGTGLEPQRHDPTAYVTLNGLHYLSKLPSCHWGHTDEEELYVSTTSSSRAQV